ncbi:tRNA dihydrouridine synthase DusB [Xanthobacter autotrophicus]|uniref:tRNA dihydrouridine synthase DusB n=1 Tax=Xanthobacter TaxID=279 RepID=UPI0024ABCF94|nr:tRNA dihydrouridine synthase DusB [Xanthobacter autotrophicus]MDI4664379.1 tRNA dihydrouridine synthase DusB [Xanthobacter autotrophicus]
MQETVAFSIPALRIGSHALPNAVILAPMAGITDAPVRRMAVRYGAGLVISEMVASEALLEGHPEMVLRAEGEGVPLHAVQIAGNDPRLMAQAARVAEAAGAGIIDINMGCPAKRVTTGAAGAALLRDLPLAGAILDAVRSAVAVPVTVKTRLGWDDGASTAVDLARMAQESGLAMITIHGRTRCQFYTGRADWTAIRAVKDAVSIPVVANGDVVATGDGPAILAASGAAGVMIGRGAQGRPWFPGRVAQAIAGVRVAEDPPLDEQRAVLLELYEGWLGLYGRALGVRQARKHVGWALDAVAAGSGEARAAFVARWRKRLLVLDDPAEVKAGIVDAFDDIMWRAAA